MDIDRKLLSRAAALLNEARDAIERVYKKASDYPVLGEGVDEDKLTKLSTLITEIESLMTTTDNLAKED